MITMIAAAAENNALGKNNELIWHLPDDFKRFKQITTGHHIIMGRKTFESFPKPLPNRTHVIITRQESYIECVGDNCIVVRSMEEAIAVCPQEKDIFIIGGGEIYELGIKIAHKIELTRVHEHFEADAFFPEISHELWELVEKDFRKNDEKHKHDFTFQTFVRKGLL